MDNKVSIFGVELENGTATKMLNVLAIIAIIFIVDTLLRFIFGWGILDGLSKLFKKDEEK